MNKGMNISAIISEYNPFHNGHKYHIMKTKETGASHIVAIMGGNFTQRGDVSIINKQSKTRIALNNGVDLVVELQTPYTISCAEVFAKKAVYLADCMGCIDTLSFGSECGDIELLTKAANVTNLESFRNELKNQLSKGISFPKAKQNAIMSTKVGFNANIFSTPNNVLAIEYIKALNKIDSKIRPITIKRNVAHDSKTTISSISSASYIRDLILNCNNEYKKFIPKSAVDIIDKEIKAGKCPASMSNIEKAILYKLRISDNKCLQELPDISEGLENRIEQSIKRALSVDTLIEDIKTKRYTHARIRRILLYNFLDIKKQTQEISPQYIRILGFNKKGLEILNVMKKTSKLPLVVRASDIKELDEKAFNLYKFECKCTDVYNLSTPKIYECGSEYKNYPIKG